MTDWKQEMWSWMKALEDTMDVTKWSKYPPVKRQQPCSEEKSLRKQRLAASRKTYADIEAARWPVQPIRATFVRG